MIETKIHKAMWENMQPIEPKYSAEQLFNFLERDDFENGAHVDIYDILWSIIQMSIHKNRSRSVIVLV